MGERILIVEDEFLVAMDLENIAISAGHEVLGVAADMATVRELGFKPTVAFVDLNLRDGPTGCRIARHLSAEAGSRIIYVTANPAQILEPAPTAVGYVRKPFSRSAIEAALLRTQGLAIDDPLPHGVTFFQNRSAA